MGARNAQPRRDSTLDHADNQSVQGSIARRGQGSLTISRHNASIVTLSALEADYFGHGGYFLFSYYRSDHVFYREHSFEPGGFRMATWGMDRLHVIYLSQKQSTSTHRKPNKLPLKFISESVLRHSNFNLGHLPVNSVNCLPHREEQRHKTIQPIKRQGMH